MVTEYATTDMRALLVVCTCTWSDVNIMMALLLNSKVQNAIGQNNFRILLIFSIKINQKLANNTEKYGSRYNDISFYIIATGEQ